MSELKPGQAWTEKLIRFCQQWADEAPQASGLHADFRVQAEPSVFTGDWRDPDSRDDPVFNISLPDLSFRKPGETTVRVEDALVHIGAYADYFQTLLDVQREAGMEPDRVWEYTRLHAKLLTSEPDFSCDLHAYDKINELIDFLSFLQNTDEEPFWDLESGWGLVGAHHDGRVMLRQGDCGSLSESKAVSLFFVSFEESAAVAAKVLSDGRAFAAAMKAAVGIDYWSDYGRGEPDEWITVALSPNLLPPPS